MGKRKYLTKKEREYLKSAAHDIHCGCRNKNCILIRRIRRHRAAEAKPDRDVIRKSTHITADDLSVTTRIVPLNPR